MKLLQERIAREGRVLPGNIVKVDGFLNHRVDTALLRACCEEFKAHFADKEIDLIMTCEASGIPIATIAAEIFSVPMLFAKKAKSGNLGPDVYTSEVQSYTYAKPVTLTCSKSWLHKGDRVLVVDDFMARGQAIHGLMDIIEQAGAELVGIGIAIEKGFQGGGDALRAYGVDCYSLAVIEEANENEIRFRE